MKMSTSFYLSLHFSFIWKSLLLRKLVMHLQFQKMICVATGIEPPNYDILMRSFVVSFPFIPIFLILGLMEFIY